MAKIVSKSTLVLGTNLKFNIVDKAGTNIAIGVSGATLTLTAGAALWLTSSETAGIINRAIAVGDTITVGHTATAANEGITARVTAVTATVITATILTQPSGTAVNEAAGSNINITALKKTYQFLEAGGLSFIDGVQGIVLKSKMDDLWDASDLDRYPPAWVGIEPRAKALANYNGWTYHDLSTYNAIRDTALEIRPTTKDSAAVEINALLRSTADAHAATDQITYWYGGDAEMTAPSNFVMTGSANQLVKIYDNTTGTPVDKRGTWYTRLAIAGKTIVKNALLVQYAEIVPFSAANSIDPKLTVLDATIAAGGIYSAITFNLDADSLSTGDVNGTSYTFAGFIQGNGQTNESIHAKLNYLWRQPTNINTDGTGPARRGDKQSPITQFSGDAFTVQAYLQNYNATQRNNITLVDTGGTARAWPSIYTRTIVAGALAVGGRMSLIQSETFGTANPVYLVNESGVEQKDILIAATQSIVIAYSTYNRNGHAPNTPIGLVLTWNRPGYIETENAAITQGAASETTTISPVASTGYTAA